MSTAHLRQPREKAAPARAGAASAPAPVPAAPLHAAGLPRFLHAGLARAASPGAESAGAGPVPASVHETLRAPGRPLDRAKRAFMEPRFGRDLGHVRVHTDSGSAASARAVSALAYTVGSDVVFGAGQYAPATPAGQRLLAHELTHVLQQAGAPPGLQGLSPVDVHDPAEREAAANAVRVGSGQRLHATPAPRGGVALQRQPAPAPTPAGEQDFRDFVRMTIDFFTASAAHFGSPFVQINQAVFERATNSWYTMVVDREQMIDTHLAGDAALKTQLHDAYSAAIRALVSKAAATFKRDEADLYRENSGRIPPWAWPTPSREEAGFSTPIPIGESVNAAGNVGFALNGFAVTILPDTQARGRSRAETEVDVNWGLPGYRFEVRNRQRIITSFTAPQPPTAQIRTTYPLNMNASVQSGYGRGTTPEDVAGGRVTPHSTTLGFHEGSHGSAFLDFMRANPAPQFTGRVGMTEAEFVAARRQWNNDLRDYSRRMNAFSLRVVDCVGTTIDQFGQSQARPGAAVRLVCVP